MKQWRLLMLSCLMLLITGFGLTVGQPRTGFAAVSVRVQLPEDVRTTDQRVTLKVYQLGSQVRRTSDWHALQQELAGKPPMAMDRYVRQNHLKALTSVSGQAEVKFRGQAGQAYLLVQSTKLQPFVSQRWVQPLALKVTNQMEILEAKGTTVTEKPYFYKYGTKTNGATPPLAGARFVLTQQVAGQSLYLTQHGGWSSVRNDQTIQQFTSDKEGLVRYDGSVLSPGDYEFREIVAPKGYEISQAAEHVTLHIPTSGRILVQGTVLEPLVAGHVPETVATQKSLRVYNPQQLTTGSSETSGQGVTDGTNNGKAIISKHDKRARSSKRHQPFWLPQTNEERTMFAVVGGLIILAATGLLRHYRHTYTSKKER